jgi:actin-like ATPase involved in cell morphogenesis
MLLWKLYLKPPELADIYNTGIYLAGGGSMLRGIGQRISQKQTYLFTLLKILCER